MESSSSATAIVTLKKASEGGVAQVTVGVAVQIGAKPGNYHFQSSYHTDLHGRDGCLELYTSPDMLAIACGIGAVNGADHFRRQHPEKFDYQFIFLEGKNLPADCTVGFNFASMIAVSRAVGVNFLHPGGTDGWVEA